MIFASYQISVNSFWLVLRPRLFSLLSFSLIGVSILVGGSWIGEVSPCIASTAKRTRLEDNREHCEKHKTLTQLQHFMIRFLSSMHTTIAQLKTSYLDIISALWKFKSSWVLKHSPGAAEAKCLIISLVFTYQVSFVITHSKSNIF